MHPTPSFGKGDERIRVFGSCNSRQLQPHCSQRARPRNLQYALQLAERPSQSEPRLCPQQGKCRSKRVTRHVHCIRMECSSIPVNGKRPCSTSSLSKQGTLWRLPGIRWRGRWDVSKKRTPKRWLSFWFLCKPAREGRLHSNTHAQATWICS